MRALVLLVGIVLLSITGGCCGSNQPLYTPETIKQDLDIAGTWETYDSELKKFNTECPITVEALGNGKFKASWSEKRNVGGASPIEKYTVVLAGVELDGSLYLDIESSGTAEDFLSVMLAGRHAIALVQIKGDRLQIDQLNPQETAACAAEAHFHVTGRWGNIALDEPTADLQKFIAAHRDRIFQPTIDQPPVRARRIAKTTAPE